MKKDRRAENHAYYLAHKKEKKEYELAHQEQIKKRRKKHQIEHLSEIKIYNRKYRAENPEKERTYQETYRAKHPEQKKASSEKRRKEHPDQVKISYKRYQQTPKGKIRARKQEAARRHLGFVPLNKKLPGTIAHHIDMERVIWMPRKLHESIPHSVLRNRNMEKINKAAFRFLEENINE